MTQSTTTGQEPGAVLHELDRGLASHPQFGADEQIIRRAAGRLRLVLDHVIDRSPELTARLQALRTTEGEARLEQILAWCVAHPVVRNQLEQETRRWHDESSGDADRSTPAGVVAVLSRALEAARNPVHGTDEVQLLHAPRDGDLTEDLEALCRQYFVLHPDTVGEFVAIDEDLVRRLDEARQLAVDLLPLTAPGTLRHLRAIAVVDATTIDGGRLLSAAGGDQLPGVVLLDRAELTNVWDAAVRLLHEALHEKLFEIARAGSIVAEPVDTVAIPWRLERWENRRVFAAFHVYAHLIAVHQAIELKADVLEPRYGRPPHNPGVSRPDTTATRESTHETPESRATWLAHQLAGPRSRTLTPAGRRMLQWLISTIHPVLPLRTPDAGPEAVRVADQAAAAGRASSAGGTADEVVQVEGLVLREVPEGGMLAVLNPSDRSVHTLNLSGWLVLALADGRSWTELRAAYRAAVAGKVPAGTEDERLRVAVGQLRAAGLVSSRGA